MRRRCLRGFAGMDRRRRLWGIAIGTGAGGPPPSLYRRITTSASDSTPEGAERPPRPRPVTPREFAYLLKKICPDHMVPPRLGLAISGGVDSMALAHLVAQLALRGELRHQDIHAFVVDHGLRPGSAAEAQEVGAYLRQHYKFTTHVLALTPPHPSLPTLSSSPPGTVELTARLYRYHLLSQQCLKMYITHLLAAHHNDDQAETVLMRLVGGTGYAGAAGMRAIAKPPESKGVRGAVGALNVLRPFLVPWEGGDFGQAEAGRGLGVEKERLVETCRQAGVKWWEDVTNGNRTYTRRNAIRWLLSPGAGGHVLPRALQRDSLVRFAWRMHERVFWEDTAITEKLLRLGGASMSICTFSGCATLTLPRWTSPPPTAPRPSDPPPAHPPAPASPPPSNTELSALARLLYRVVELLTPLQRPDTRPLRATATLALFYPELLPHPPRTFTCSGLLWTPIPTPPLPGNKDPADFTTWTLTRQPLPRPEADHPGLSLSATPGHDAEWRLFDNRFYLRRRWRVRPQAPPKGSPQPPPALPPLRIVQIPRTHLSSSRKLLAEDSCLLSSRATGTVDLTPLTPRSAATLINTAFSSLPAYARLTVPIAVNAVTGELVGFPSLGVWRGGVFGEEGGEDGAVECVVRGDGEFVGEDAEGAGLGRGWAVRWVRYREGGLGMKKGGVRGGRRREGKQG